MFVVRVAQKQMCFVWSPVDREGTFEVRLSNPERGTSSDQLTETRNSNGSEIDL